MDSVAEELTNTYLSEETVNKEAFIQDIQTTFGIEKLHSLKEEKVNSNDVLNELKDKIHEIYEQKEAEFGSEDLRELERVIMLKIVDQKWMDHIDAMDELKNGIGLRAYGQKDPVVQYRIEGFDMFDEMIANIKIDVVRFLLNARKRETGIAQRQDSVHITSASLEDTAIKSLDGTTPKKDNEPNTPIVNKEPKVGRNDPCICGSGKKYKNCCGK